MLRFAPSPTGDMHIGNLRVALLNYIVAKQQNKQFIIRIEDTDQKRNIEGKDKEILDTLEKFGISWDQVVYQSNNFHRYRELAIKLLKEKKAFICKCTPEEIEAQREEAKQKKIAYRYSGKCENLTKEEIEKIQKENIPFVIRVKKPIANITFKDIIKGEITTKPNEVDSFIILRADQTPTYNFACAIDDMLMNIDFIIRGEDHLSNTPKQIYIQQLFGYIPKIKYAHLPIILNEDGKKMSKRENSSSIKWLLEEGFLPQAIANYLLTLGYSPKEEIFTINDAIKWYDISKISKSPAKFNLEHLRYINRKHLEKMDSLELARLFNFPDRNIGELLKLYLQEASTIKELQQKLDTILSPKPCKENEWEEEIKILASIIKEAPHFEDYNDFKEYLVKKSSLKGKRLFKPLRILLTGKEHGPELKDIYPLIKSYLKEIVKCKP